MRASSTHHVGQVLPQPNVAVLLEVYIAPQGCEVTNYGCYCTAAGCGESGFCRLSTYLGWGGEENYCSICREKVPLPHSLDSSW